MSSNSHQPTSMSSSGSHQPHQLKGGTEDGKMTTTPNAQDQFCQTASSFNQNFAGNREQPANISCNNAEAFYSTTTTASIALSESVSEGGFSPINPLQRFELKTSPVTFISPSNQSKIKRIKKTTSIPNRTISADEPSMNDKSSLHKDATTIPQIRNPENEASSANSQTGVQGFSGDVSSVAACGMEEASGTQNIKTAENSADFQLCSNSQNVAIIHTKSSSTSQNTGSTASSSKSNSPLKLSAGSGRFGTFPKNGGGSSESLTGTEGGVTSTQSNQGGYYVNRNNGGYRNSGGGGGNKMNSPKKKYSGGGNSGNFSGHGGGKFRSGNNRNSGVSSQQYNKHAATGGGGNMGHKKKMSTGSNSSASHSETTQGSALQQQQQQHQQSLHAGGGGGAVGGCHGLSSLEDSRSMSPSLLALLSAHASSSQVNDPNVSAVPPMQTQQVTSSLVTSHLEKSPLMNNFTCHSSPTTYLSPSAAVPISHNSNNRASAGSGATGCVTQNWPLPVNAVRSNGGGLEQMVSSVVITQPPFQPTSTAIAARPNVNPESASFFAGNQYAVPTVRDVNTNAGSHSKGPKSENNSYGNQNSYGNNNGTFSSSKKRNRNQQSHKNPYNTGGGQSSSQSRNNFNASNSGGPTQNVPAGVVPFGYPGLPVANSSTALNLSAQPHLAAVAATNAGLSQAAAVMPASNPAADLGGLNDILQRIQLNPLQFTVPGLTNSLNLLNASMAFQAAGSVGSADQTGQLNNTPSAPPGDHLNCPSPNPSLSSQNNVTPPTNTFMDLSLQAMIPGLNPKVSNLMGAGVRDNIYNPSSGTPKVSGNPSSSAATSSTTESALQFIVALQQAQSLSDLASRGYNPSANTPHSIDPSKIFYNLVASQYPSPVYGGAANQPLLTSFFNTMINNPLNVPLPPTSVSTPPSNPTAPTSSHDVITNASNTPTSRGEASSGAYNANAYFQSAAMFSKNMGGVGDYSNQMFNESVVASGGGSGGMNSNHVRLNNSAPPFEGGSNRAHNTMHKVVSEAQSKGPSPVQLEEWGRNKRKVKRNDNATGGLGSSQKNYSSSPSASVSSQVRSKRGTFCVVTPDEVGSSSYHCTELSHPLSVQIWNPTNIPVLIHTTIQKLTVVTERKSGSNSSPPLVESPFSTEGSFMLDANKKDFLKIVFRSNITATYHADLIIEATSVHSVSPDKPKMSFVKTIKLTASATDVMIAKYIRNMDGSFEHLGDHYELGNMKPGSTYRTDILFENRSQALATILLNFHEDRGSTLSVVALNGVELPNPLNKLSFDTHGFVDLGAHINYHTVCMTVEVFIPTTWRDTKAQLQFALYATISAGNPKAPARFLHSTTFNSNVVQPKLYIPPHAQHIELHNLAVTQNVPMRSCSSKPLQLTLRCNNSAFIVNPVEMQLQPYTVVPVAITFDRRYKREQASVIITVEPEGPVYTVNVDGKILDNEKPSLMPLEPKPPGSVASTSTCTCQKSRKTGSSTPVTTDSSSLSQSVLLKEKEDEGAEEVASTSAPVEQIKKQEAPVEKRRERLNLKTKMLLSSAEYLFFAGGSASKPEKLTCQFKNNSSCYAKWKFSISPPTRIFSVVEVCRVNNEAEDLSDSQDGITVAPQEMLKVTVQFHSANSKFDFMTGFLIISSAYNDCYSLVDEEGAVQNLGFPAEPNLDVGAAAATSRMMLPSYFDTSRDIDESKSKSPNSRLPLYAYTGTCHIKATVKQHANLKWNTPAIVSVRNTGDRNAYVIITSSHASDATPSCFSLPPNGETLISRLFCKSESDGTVLEITWGDAILKHVFNHFSTGVCSQTSKQNHAFLMSSFQMNDGPHGDKLPKREFYLNPQILTKNIFCTHVCLTVDSKKTSKTTCSPLSQETGCSMPENPNPVNFDRPTEADFPRLVASPLGDPADRNGGPGKTKSRSDGKPWSINPQPLVMEYGNVDYEESKNGFMKIVGVIAVTNNSNELNLGCEITSANGRLKLRSSHVKLGHRETREISVEAIIKRDLMLSTKNTETPFEEVHFKLMFEDRETRLRPPICDKIVVFLPWSKPTFKTRGPSFQPYKILDADFEESSNLPQCWQMQFPQTKTGDWANENLIFSNLTKVKLKWTLTSMCYPFISVTSNSTAPKASPAATTSAPVEPEFSKPSGPCGTLFKVKHQVFRFERTSAFLDSGDTAVIEAEFAPLESGSFIQHFELSFQKRVATEGEKDFRVQRIYFKGTGVGRSRSKSVRDSSPKKMERIDFISDLPSELRDKFTVFVTESVIRFEETPCGSTDRKFLFIRNSDATKQHQVKFLNPEPPFVMNHGGYEIGTRRILKVPVVFKPTTPGTYSSFFIIITDSPSKSVIPTFLHGVAVKPKSKSLVEPPAPLSSEQTILESPTSCDTTNDGEGASRIKSHSEESFEEFIKYTEESQSLVFANSSTVTSKWPRHPNNSGAEENTSHAKQTFTSSTVVETQYLPATTSNSASVQSSVCRATSKDTICMEPMSDIPDQIPHVEELQDSLPNQDVGFASATVMRQGPAPLAQVPQTSVSLSSTVANIAISRDESGLSEHITDGKK